MKRDLFITEVIFRKEASGAFEGIVTAYFPYNIETKDGKIACYSHVGQHSSANYYHCMTKSVLAEKHEYNDLYHELESMGYNLRVIKKINHRKQYDALRKAGII